MILVRVMQAWERMGSGGLRGLQIPRSGASCVRGGFDSHAFPPLLRRAIAALTLALALAVPARAQEPVLPDSAAAADTSAILTTGEPRVRRTVSAADSARRHVWHEAPRWVMARSLLVPGWGQAHNGAWFKAVGVATGEVWLATLLVKDQKELDRLMQEIVNAQAANDQQGEAELVNQYNARLDLRVSRQWLLGALLAYAMIDAYVDAHFRGFELEFQTDPALPTGRDPAPGGRGVVGARLALRWDF